MARIEGYEQSQAPNTEQRVDYKPTSIAPGLGQLGQGVEALGQTIKKRSVDVAKAQADLQVTNNAVAQELSISTMKKSVDLTNPDAFNEVMKPYDDANDALLENTDNEEVRAHITNTVADHRARYVQMVISKNAKLQSQDFLASKDKTMNALSFSTQQNPGLLADNIDTAHKLFNGLLDAGISEGAVEAQREKAVTKLNRDAADGYIQSDPAEAKKIIEDGKLDLGDKYDVYLKKCDTAIEARKTRALSEEKRVKAVVKEGQTKNYKDDMVRVLQNDPTVFDDIQKSLPSLNTPTARYAPEQYTSLSNAAKQRIKHDGKDDPTMSRQAEKYLRDNEGDFEGVFNRYGNGLSSATAKRLVDTHSLPTGASADDRSNFRSLEDEAYKSQVHPTISPFGDREGLKSYGDTMNKIHERYTEEVKAGTPASELFDKSGKGKSLYRMITPTTASEVKQKRINAYTKINNPDQTVSGAGNDNPQTPKEKPQLNEKQNAIIQKMMSGLPKPEGRK